MSDAFWSARDLLQDRDFLLSAAVSLVAVIIIGSLLAYFLSEDKIIVTPIAEISFVDAPQKFKDSPKPISELYQLTQIGGMKKKQVAAENGYVWSGFIVSIGRLCKMDMNKNYIVIIRTYTRMMAATADITQKTCDLMNELSDDEEIYAISDIPLNSESKRVYLSMKIPNYSYR